ncbi:MAG: response regulator [Xanthomonadales bacterium]|jgi:chemosensory pili system protein ChpA (sensor histidine kinase/response regulator)|nr:response regulator [Xanthomonadales bacterium]
MMQPGTLTPTALGWIREDLDREIERMRAQIEAIADNANPGQAALDGASERLGELARIFETLMMDGARQVTAEMQRLVEFLGRARVPDREAVTAALVEAVVVLPAYLDRLQSGKRDLPVLLLPLINQMRESTGDDPLSEGTVFSPLLDVELPELEFVRKPGYDEPFEYLTDRLHRQYEKALQNWLAEQDQTALLSPMQGICETMRHRVDRYDLKRLWWVATEVFGGLMDGHVDNDVHLRRLMARLSHLIQRMSEQGEDGIDERTSTSVTQALLFHIGNADSGSQGVDLVRERFELDKLASDSDAMMRASRTLSGQDREMYESLSAAVEDELAIVKDALDLELRTGQVEADRRQQSTEALSRLADTLSMLGLSAPGARLAGLIPVFAGSAEAESAEREAALGKMAEELLLVESALREQVETLGEDEGEPEESSFIALSAHEQRGIRARLLDECVTSMHAAQDAVRERFSGKHGQDPDEALMLVAGALELARDTETAALTERLADTLKRFLRAARDELEITETHRETIADAMAALEMYLSALRDRQRDASHLVDLVRERLDEIEAELTEPETPEASAPRDAADSEPEPVPTVSLVETSADGAPEPEVEAPAEVVATDADMESVEAIEAEAEPAVSAVPAEAEAQAAEPEPAGEPADVPAPAPAPAPGPAPAAAATAAEDADELPPEIDPELREIFLEEYEEVLQELQGSIPQWINQLDNAEALTEIRRAFHTLKGSGRMVGADELGDFSWQIENMLNALLEGRGKNFSDAAMMVRLAEASLPALRQRLLQEPAGLNASIIRQIGDIAEHIARNEGADWAGLQPQLPVYLASLLPSDIAAAPAAAPAPQAGGADDEVRELLKAELAQHLQPIRELVDSIAQDRATRTSPDQVRAAHTIAGALAMEPEGLDAGVAKALEGLLETQSRTGKEFSPDAMFTVISAVGQLQNRLERLEGYGDLSPAEEQQELIDQLTHLQPQFDGPALDDAAAEPGVVEPETFEPGSVEPPAERGADAPSEFDPGRSVFGANDEAAEETEDGLTFTSSPVEALSEKPLEDVQEEARKESLDELEESSREDITEELDASEATVEAGPLETDAAEEATPEPPKRFEPPVFTPPEETSSAPAPQEPVREPEAPRAPASEEAVAGTSGETLDPEIVEIFLEEAAEVLERGENALNEWRDDLEQLNWVQELQREIHTFKGGARMAGLLSIGDFAHEMEELLERIADRVEQPSLSAVQLLEDACDRLLGWVDQVRDGQAPDAGQALELLKQQIAGLGDVIVPMQERPAAPSSEESPAVRELPEAEVQDEVAAEPDSLPEPTAPAEAMRAIPAATPAREPSAVEDPASGGTIKVPADLLDRLVNASGEVSIYRSRLEQQIGKLKGNIAEFDETIDRLSEQFRKMDIEIEAQIRANYPDEVEAQGENFDPLELDQFSALQQATRSLQESVADLLSLQEMAEENLRASEQLLTRQSRVSTELQEGLMKTRMVPFATIAPRLRRIVRSATKEEGKQARLQLQMVGTSDELDRNVLEHITAPLEHMMRNAVAHGIESPEMRRERDKPAEGEITITVESEATEFVIRIADDGGGIPLEKIRQKAIDRGLLDVDSEPSRQQLYAFMMDSGFSTSSSVTKIAGRGVGMDVVNSDIKQIGGSLEIDSEPGEGTQFTIRIPFTLAIMQAIGIEAGDARYLLPLSSVVGVSRIMPDDYRSMVEAEEPVYRFAGQEYPVLDIEPLLGERSTPLGRDNVSLLVLSAGEQKAAVRVPQLLPHREVVIKPVGPQISSVAGVLGGSISGDGEVMVILDPGPLIRQAMIHGYQAPVESSYTAAARNRKLVIVVDDSITMRKVTSRVLEGKDYEVITARDGVDALEQLQDRTPDIMLFDIEMPRMDGYELTERVRDDGRFRHTPIMMITSRAGQKHQDRAMQAGATAYLTKPYREDELLMEVERLLHEAKETT